MSAVVLARSVNGELLCEVVNGRVILRIRPFLPDKVVELQGWVRVPSTPKGMCSSLAEYCYQVSLKTSSLVLDQKLSEGEKALRKGFETTYVAFGDREKWIAQIQK